MADTLTGWQGTQSGHNNHCQPGLAGDGGAQPHTGPGYVGACLVPQTQFPEGQLCKGTCRNINLAGV